MTRLLLIVAVIAAAAAIAGGSGLNRALSTVRAETSTVVDRATGQAQGSNAKTKLKGAVCGNEAQSEDSSADEEKGSED
jgi:hypothetical protein